MESAPLPTGGAYSAPPDPLTALRGPTSKEGEGRAEGREGAGRGGERGGRKGTGGKGRGREKGSRREGIAVEKNPYFKAWKLANINSSTGILVVGDSAIDGVSVCPSVVRPSQCVNTTDRRIMQVFTSSSSGTLVFLGPTFVP